MTEQYTVPTQTPSQSPVASPPIQVQAPQGQPTYSQAQPVSYPTQGTAAMQPQQAQAPQTYQWQAQPETNVIPFPTPGQGQTPGYPQQPTQPGSYPQPSMAPSQGQPMSFQQMGNYNSPQQGNDNFLAQALNKALDVLATPVFNRSSQPQSQPQVQSYQQGQSSSPVQHSSLGVPIMPQSMGSQTLQPNQAYSPSSSQPSSQQQGQFPLSGVQRTSAEYPSDAELQQAGYTLSGVNQFACEVEEALAQTAIKLDQANAENQAIRGLMTDPNRLGQYVMEFYGPNGPYPVQEAQAQVAQMEQQAYGQQYQPQQYQPQGDFIDPRIMPDGAGLESTTARPVDPIGFQRPTFPDAPTGQMAQQLTPDQLGQLLAQNPNEAWKYIDQMDRGGVLRGMVLAVDS